MGSRDDALDDQEFEQLLEACDPKKPRERLVILLAGDLGMREGEIAHLRRCWVNFQKGHVVIPSKDGGWAPKTKWGARTIPPLRCLEGPGMQSKLISRPMRALQS
jgi:integrase